MHKLLAAHGCEVVYAPLETPSAKQGGEVPIVMKAMLRKIIADAEATDFEVWLRECLVMKNTRTRSNIAQLGKNPRAPGSVTDLEEVGLRTDKLDPGAQFYCVLKPS